MPELKLKQLQHETDTWKRSLGFMMDENVHLKNRLSEILKNNFDQNLLEDAESFHSGFIKEDELISLLRNDIVELDKFLLRETFEDGKISKDLDRTVKKLRKNMDITEKQFSRLKSEFNSYLSENIQSG